MCYDPNSLKEIDSPDGPHHVSLVRGTQVVLWGTLVNLTSMTTLWLVSFTRKTPREISSLVWELIRTHSITEISGFIEKIISSLWEESNCYFDFGSSSERFPVRWSSSKGLMIRWQKGKRSISVTRRVSVFKLVPIVLKWLVVDTIWTNSRILPFLFPSHYSSLTLSCLEFMVPEVSWGK